jgi:hypothetical protein
MGYETVDDVVQRDKNTMWLENNPSVAYRNTVMPKDVQALIATDDVLLMEGWEQHPEAVAIAYMAVAMKKTLKDLPASVYELQEITT